MNRTLWASLCSLACWLAFAGASIRAEEKNEGRQESSPSYAGTWVRSTRIDELLGNADRKLVIPSGGGVHVSPVIELVVDETPNERTIELSESWIEAVGHANIKRTGRIHFREVDERFDPEEANICAFTHHEGNTYVWFAVPNLGMLPLRLSAIAGASEKQDFLFVDWIPDDRFRAVNRAVTAYRRLAK
jgi:hypothetical protein